MAVADLQGPLDDFRGRIAEIRSIMVAIESAGKTPDALTTSRPGIDLTKIDAQTGNTVNSMSLVFIASSFEEFFREEISQCAGYMRDRYQHLLDSNKHAVRAAYWKASLDYLRIIPPILTKKEPRVPDAAVVGKIRTLLDAAQSFVIGDNANLLNPIVFTHHSNNFRPQVIEEIAGRLGIKTLINSVADSHRLKAYFGVSKKADAAEKLRAKLEEFYVRRNETVHSLNSTTGYAVDVILDYMEFFDATADSIKNFFTKELATW